MKMLSVTSRAISSGMMAQAKGLDGFGATGIACNVYDGLNGKPPQKP